MIRYNLMPGWMHTGVTMIVDAKYLAYRTQYSSTGKLSYGDLKTGLYYGFFNTLQSVANKLNVTNTVMMFDITKLPNSVRKKAFPGYKLRDKKWEDLTPEERALKEDFNMHYLHLMALCEQLGFACYALDGYEADDLIALWCLQYPRAHQVIITRDEDMYQCITDLVSIYNPDDKFVKNLSWFTKTYEGINPDDWSMVKALAGCFDKETEMLTNRGWVFLPNINKEDLVYSMCPKSQEATYEPITKLIKYHYTGNMYSITGKLIDLLVTPNHEFFGQRTQSYNKIKIKTKVETVENIIRFKNFSIPIVSFWKGKEEEYFILPEYKNLTARSSQPYNKKELKIKMEDWLSFLGIWLSEGGTAKNRQGALGCVRVGQYGKVKRRVIKSMLKRLPFKWSENLNGFETNSVQLAQYLHKIGNTFTKFIPQEFKDLSPRLLKILIHWMVMGDGCISKTHQCFNSKKSYKRTSYFSSNKKLINDFQEIVIKCGMSAMISEREPRMWHIRGKSGWSKKQYCAQINKSKTLNLSKKEIKLVNFNDYVYDVTTEPYHTVLVRRNGHVVWSNNCKSDMVPGLPGVGETTAIKYIRGGATDAVREKIKKNADLVRLYLSLVRLPHDDLKNFRVKLKRTKVNDQDFFQLCQQMGFKSFIDKWDDFRIFF